MKPVKRKTVSISIILIIILGFAVYNNSLNGEFVWDDEILIKHNEYIKDLRNIPGLFTKNITYGLRDESNFYRPLQMLTYLLTYSIFKLDPRIYHLTNVILHILVALMLYWLVQIIFKDKLVSLIIGLLFVSHPIHTETVNYISGRADLMVALFALSTSVFYVKYSRIDRISFYFLSLIAYFLALLCKESALIIPFLLIAYDFIYKGAKQIQIKRYIPFFLLGVIYIILRKTTLNFTTKNIIEETTLSQRIPVIFSSMTMYFKKILFPSDLHMEYELIVPSINDIRVTLGAAIILVFILTAVIYRRTEKIISFSIAWFFINYLPISNIYPLNSFFAEHWIYIPSFGLFILVGFIAVRIYRKGQIFRKSAFLSLILLVVYSSYFTVRQNRYWNNPKDFYERTLKFNPNSPRIYHRLSLLYFEKGMLDEGIEKAKKAVAIDPDYIYAHENLALAHLMKAEYDMAIDECKKVLKIDPDSINAHLYLGNAYFKKGWNDRAINEFEKILLLNPNHASAHFNLSTIYFNRKQYDLAVKHCNRAVELGCKVPSEFLRLLKQCHPEFISGSKDIRDSETSSE